ncbi:MAG: GNAT family N-acetyltransferase [Thermodesulfobacteriota bacterium]
MADLILLHTATDNRAARSLFESEGFRAVRIRPGFYPRSQDAVLMVKDLREK